jgi:arylsulfatase A-like enzyme
MKMKQRPAALRSMRTKRRGPRRIASISALALFAIVVTTTPARAQPGPISLSPTHGPVGASVTITGTGLLLTNHVYFGSVEASFQANSDSEVTAVVPDGAVTAPVQVDTPEGSSTSDGDFVVQPNIVMLLTDDQRWDTLSYMPNLESEIVDHGVTFTNAFVENPLCCPSRASFLTGNDSHTTGVYSNNPPFGGFSAFDDHATLATWLHDAGYRTALVGKYLNHYDSTDGTYVPPGWDRWRAFATGPKYFNYELSVDGTSIESFGSDPADYSTDVLSSVADTEIRSTSAQDPLFLWLAVAAPHGPFTPAPRDAGSLNGIAPWRPPSYDEADVSDKPAYIQAHPRLTPDAIARIDSVRQSQLETLGAVDDAVDTLTTALQETGRLSDTIFIFASDNGYLWGEHRREAKVFPYEESIRVPFVIRWDRLIDAPRTDAHLVENVDLAPTLVEAASAEAGFFDGRTLMPLLTGGSVPWRNHMLIEHAGPVNGPRAVPAYCADRTPKDILIHYETGEEEYYPLGPRADAYERTNKITVAKFQARIATLRNTLRGMCDPLPPNLPPF